MEMLASDNRSCLSGCHCKKLECLSVAIFFRLVCCLEIRPGGKVLPLGRVWPNGLALRQSRDKHKHFKNASVMKNNKFYGIDTGSPRLISVRLPDSAAWPSCCRRRRHRRRYCFGDAGAAGLATLDWSRCFPFPDCDPSVIEITKCFLSFLVIDASEK
jgi:hypothetical protein